MSLNNSEYTVSFRVDVNVLASRIGEARAEALMVLDENLPRDKISDIEHLPNDEDDRE